MIIETLIYTVDVSITLIVIYCYPVNTFTTH